MYGYRIRFLLSVEDKTYAQSPRRVVIFEKEVFI